MAGAGMGLMLGQANTDAINRTSRYSYGEATGITQTVRNYGASLGYRFKRDTRIGLGASYYTRRSSTAVFRDYDGLRIGTTVTYGF